MSLPSIGWLYIPIIFKCKTFRRQLITFWWIKNNFLRHPHSLAYLSKGLKSSFTRKLQTCHYHFRRCNKCMSVWVTICSFCKVSIKKNVLQNSFRNYFFHLSLFHCPIHGPHALVKILLSSFSKISIIPSLSAVYLTCSDPGLIPSLDLIFYFIIQSLFCN